MSKEKASLSDNDIWYMFTAYLQTALRRKRERYLQKIEKECTVNSVEYIAVEDNTFEYLCKNASLSDLVENQQLLKALGTISERERHILTLRVIHQKKYREMAQILGMNQSAVENAYSRLLFKLRKRMGDVHNV